MATNKWLNIVVDGNSALCPYWPKIVSDYLKKIVRSFFGNLRGEGNGLIEVTDLITDRGNGQLTVLLSRNFKEAHCIHSWTTLDEDPLTHLLELDQSMSINEILGQVFRTSTSTSGEVQVLVLVLMGASAGALAVAAASSGGIAGASSTTDAAGVVAGANINTVNPYYSSCHQQFPRHYGLEKTYKTREHHFPVSRLGFWG
ncbi:hypothetical protein D0Y65_003872 [Glycine soja]|uniref:Uncharacterized protein n=1 Tax=Glycine soja TaxID=3848 RepID=A0A445LP88_GLYSO|nr:hypothetical protein D0Y65_003872 [Glycine soja]RZC24901.1 hypothetical protein D0Y65_003872 [Glycine soja]RZC24902.1 hypothetical protein D0Y65_003872 [Glycine soja]